MIQLIEAQLRKNFPQELVAKLTFHYVELKSAFIHKRLDVGELNGGKFAEIVFRLIQYATDPKQTYTPIAQSLPSVDSLVTKFENLPNTFDDSLRLHIPRALKVIYGFRNKRGVGHAGDINPSLMDGTLVMAVCDWVLAELIRLYHVCSADDAQSIVDKLVRRTVPAVYDSDGIKTLLRQTTYGDAALVLLHNEGEKDVPLDDLCKWMECPNMTYFRNRVLPGLHREKKVYPNKEKGVCRILPPGSQYVEQVILPRIQ